MANPNKPNETPQQPNKNEDAPARPNEFPDKQPPENPNQRDSRDAEASRNRPK